MNKLELRKLIELAASESSLKNRKLIDALWKAYDEVVSEEKQNENKKRDIEINPDKDKKDPFKPSKGNNYFKSDEYCPECGTLGELLPEICLTYPPQYRYRCPKCGKTWTVYGKSDFKPLDIYYTTQKDDPCKYCSVKSTDRTYVGDSPCSWCPNSPYKVTCKDDIDYKYVHVDKLPQNDWINTADYSSAINSWKEYLDCINNKGESK